MNDGGHYVLVLPDDVYERVVAAATPMPGRTLNDTLVELISHGVTAVVLAEEEDEMAKAKYPPTDRYRVAPDGELRGGRRKWSVVDGRTERKVYPGGPLGKAHSVADRLNREDGKDR